MQNCINRLEKNSDIMVLLCTGEFPELKSNKLLIEPSKLLYHRPADGATGVALELYRVEGHVSEVYYQ
ncbi:MAG: AroM family protein [Pyrobaculum sp.]